MGEDSLDYMEYNFTVDPVDPGTDILVAELGEAGFESFLEHGNGVLAYIQKREWRTSILESVGLLGNPHFTVAHTFREIPRQNWNATWEKSFSPIRIDDRCMVRAPFHEKVPVEYDIVIEPKMSFGTGHHETTYLMLKNLLDQELKGASVLDMGCGTGVLAILAAKCGASSIDAIDIDPWCYSNAMENMERNNCGQVYVMQGDASLLGDQRYDVVLANINKNILLADIPVYARCLNAHGTLFVSGFYTDDVPAITRKCEENGLKFKKKWVKNNWVASKYVF